MTPFEMIRATYRNRWTRPLTALVVIALAPIIALFVVFHVIVHTVMGVAALYHDVRFRISDARSRHRIRKCLRSRLVDRIIDRIRLRRANASAWVHSRWLIVREYVSRNWRRAVAAPAKWLLVILVGLPCVLIETAFEKLAKGVSWLVSKFTRTVRNHVGTPLVAWSNKGS